MWFIYALRSMSKNSIAQLLSSMHPVFVLENFVLKAGDLVLINCRYINIFILWDLVFFFFFVSTRAFHKILLLLMKNFA